MQKALKSGKRPRPARTQDGPVVRGAADRRHQGEQGCAARTLRERPSEGQEQEAQAHRGRGEGLRRRGRTVRRCMETLDLKKKQIAHISMQHPGRLGRGSPGRRRRSSAWPATPGSPSASSGRRSARSAATSTPPVSEVILRTGIPEEQLEGVRQPRPSRAPQGPQGRAGHGHDPRRAAPLRPRSSSAGRRSPSRPSASSSRPTSDSWSRSRRSTRTVACSSWTSSRKATSA